MLLQGQPPPPPPHLQTGSQAEKGARTFRLQSLPLNYPSCIYSAQVRLSTPVFIHKQFHRLRTYVKGPVTGDLTAGLRHFKNHEEVFSERMVQMNPRARILSWSLIYRSKMIYSGHLERLFQFINPPPIDSIWQPALIIRFQSLIIPPCRLSPSFIFHPSLPGMPGPSTGPACQVLHQACPACRPLHPA
jgi:hypothetical protein